MSKTEPLNHLNGRMMMDHILSDGKNLQSASDRCVIARDKDQEWGTSGVSDRATSKCHQRDNAAFRR